jgi:hypothetical protein
MKLLIWNWYNVLCKNCMTKVLVEKINGEAMKTYLMRFPDCPQD